MPVFRPHQKNTITRFVHLIHHRDPSYLDILHLVQVRLILTPARRGTGVAGCPRSTVSTAIPHTPAQSFAWATGWRVGDQRREQKGCSARLHPVQLRQGDYVVAGWQIPRHVCTCENVLWFVGRRPPFSCCVANSLVFAAAWRRIRGGAVPGAAERSTGGQRRLRRPRWGIW